MLDRVSISPEAQAIYAGHCDLIATAQALDSDIDILLVREKVLMKELSDLQKNISKKHSERQACLAVASAMLECTPAATSPSVSQVSGQVFTRVGYPYNKG